MADGFNNNVQTTTDRSVSEITYTNYSLATGSNKCLAVCVGIEDQSGSLPTVSTVTFDGNSLTQRVSAHTDVPGTQPQRVDIWDRAEANNTTTGNVVVTLNETTDGDVRVCICTGLGLEQQAPEATAKTDDVVNSASVTTTVTTVTASAEIIDAISGERNTPGFQTTETGQTEILENTDLGTLGVSVKTGPDPAGNTDMGWDHATLTSIDFGHAVAAYALVAASGERTPPVGSQALAGYAGRLDLGIIIPVEA